jgi:periplasmic protein TonB
LQSIVNSRKRFAVSFDDAPTLRIAVAVVAGLLACLAMLSAMGRWIAQASPAVAHDEPLEMRMVEIEPPPVQTVAPVAQPPKAPAPPQQTHAHAPREHVVKTTPLKTDTPTQPQKDLTPTAPDIKPESTEPSHQANPNPTSAQAAPAAVNTAAHSIAQPLPALPDDLREQAFQTVATARFMIHADGSVDVELIKPTSSPRLNQILLEALHRWRFFPALQNGHPVESQQDIRVHFNVD